MNFTFSTEKKHILIIFYNPKQFLLLLEHGCNFKILYFKLLIHDKKNTNKCNEMLTNLRRRNVI